LNLSTTMFGWYVCAVLNTIFLCFSGIMSSSSHHLPICGFVRHYSVSSSPNSVMCWMPWWQMDMCAMSTISVPTQHVVWRQNVHHQNLLPMLSCPTRTRPPRRRVVVEEEPCVLMGNVKKDESGLDVQTRGKSVDWSLELHVTTTTSRIQSLYSLLLSNSRACYRPVDMDVRCCCVLEWMFEN
jgi:hypothetical protein